MRPGGLAAVAVLVLLVAACASPTRPPVGTPTPNPAPTSTSPPSGVPPTSTAAAPSPGAFASIDPALLDVLPSDVAGFPVLPAPDALGEAMSDPGVVRNVAALAAAVVADPAAMEFAFATIVRFFDGVLTDGFYRDWRDTFDAGVCEQAGGVSGTAEAEIGGRQVFIGSCANGVRTYHAWLGNRGVLVSVSAVGEQRLGERLVEDLRD